MSYTAKYLQASRTPFGVLQFPIVPIGGQYRWETIVLQTWSCHLNFLRFLDSMVLLGSIQRFELEEILIKHLSKERRLKVLVVNLLHAALVSVCKQNATHCVPVWALQFASTVADVGWKAAVARAILAAWTPRNNTDAAGTQQLFMSLSNSSLPAPDNCCKTWNCWAFPFVLYFAFQFVSRRSSRFEVQSVEESVSKLQVSRW